MMSIAIELVLTFCPLGPRITLVAAPSGSMGHDTTQVASWRMSGSYAPVRSAMVTSSSGP